MPDHISPTEFARLREDVDKILTFIGHQGSVNENLLDAQANNNKAIQAILKGETQ